MARPMNPIPYTPPAWLTTKPAFGGVMFELDGETHELVFVEYHHRRPFAVTTVEHWDHSSKPWFDPEKYSPRGYYKVQFDFEYCRKDGTIYHHKSGCGGELSVAICRLAHPASPPSCELWIASGFPLCRYSAKDERVIVRNDAELTAMGYRRLTQPRLLTIETGGSGIKTRNPFDIAEKGEFIYCRRLVRDDNTGNDDEQSVCHCEVEHDD